MVINSSGMDSPQGRNYEKKLKKRKNRHMFIVIILAIILFALIIRTSFEWIRTFKILFEEQDIHSIPAIEDIIEPNGGNNIEPPNISMIEEPPSDVSQEPMKTDWEWEEEEDKYLQGVEKFKPTKEHKTRILGNGNDIATIMIYMNGSDLEGESLSATRDIKEMLKAVPSDKVNIVIQTMSTKQWSEEIGISPDRTQRYEIKNQELVLVDELDQLSCGDSETLSNFILWSKSNYPANRNILIMWDHGGGSVFGFGNDQYDELNTLTIDEMRTALKEANINFDFIGMDCCVMSNIEVCYALYDYCDYMILSEDFESEDGWYYTNWITNLVEDTSIPTRNLGKIIADDMTENYITSSFGNSETILSVIDSSYIKVVYDKWKEFAFANTDALLENRYGIQSTNTGRMHPLIKKHNVQKRIGLFGDLFGDLLGDDSLDELITYYELLLGEDGIAGLDDYYITDMSLMAKSIESDESKELLMALHQALVYVNKTADEIDLFGMAVTLPYGDKDFYEVMKIIYSNANIDDEYINWLEGFVSVETQNNDNDDNNDNANETQDNNDGNEEGNENNPNNNDYSDYFGDYQIPSELEDMLGDVSDEEIEEWLGGMTEEDMEALNGLISEYFPEFSGLF